MHGDVEIGCAVRPVRFYMLQRVTDAYAALDSSAQTQVLDYLTPLGLAPLVTLTSKHRITRAAHTEVWA